MHIEEVAIANGASVVILIILLISRWMTRRHTRLEDRVFTIFILISIFAPILETISFLVDGRAEMFFRVTNVTVNTLLYACTATVSVLWVLYSDLHLNHNAKRSKALYVPLLIVWGGLVLALIPNIFLGFFFSFDSNHAYVREIPGYIFYVYLISSFVISIVIYIKTHLKHGESQFFPIWMFLSPVIIGCVIQVIWYGISLAWLGCAIGLLGIHVNIQSKLSLVDDLTGLYNRSYIEHRLIVARGNSRYVYSGIMLDIDYFKEINDSLGHSVGDEAIVNAANILLNISDQNSLPLRFAGDEFIILIQMPVNKADQLEAKTIEIKELIRKATDEFNKNTEVSYQIVFSMGHAFFDKTMTDDSFFHEMDVAMYKEKQQHHKECQSKLNIIN
ncbi:MAG: diguanylate cyclase [Bacilli bacterium]|nr:diguanylate cyclase [Bacilli bacterium]